MSNQRYSPEFKDEAVRQVVGRGYSIAKVADRLGVSAHSLYNWVKTVKLGKLDEQAAELNKAKKGILKLRAELRRIEEERDILKMPRSVLRKPPRVKYRFIADHSDLLPVRTMCNLLDASQSGYYEWRFRPLSTPAIEDQRLLPLIRASYAASRGVYGYRRVLLDLREPGETYCTHRVRRLMQSNGIKSLHGYKMPRVIQGRTSIIAPNRLKCAFTVAHPDCAWVTDITYVRSWQGWLYRTAVLDLYPRRIVGWSMKPTLACEIVLDVFMMAVWRRKPRQSVLIHSDQGSQYGSDDWQRFCRHHNFEPSMNRRGNCSDNAVVESFFSSLKKERIKKRIYKTRELAREDIFDYIEVFYDRTRRHSHLGGVIPEAFELTSV
ncbi:MAG: IS3 family transposase [Halioglobus sp.]